MNFYFCDNCQKRFTVERDDAGLGFQSEESKHLCPSCATQTATMDFPALKQGVSAPVNYSTPKGSAIILEPATRPRKSGSRHPTPLHSGSARHTPQVPQPTVAPQSAKRWLIPGAAGAVVLLVVVVFMMTSKPATKLAAQDNPPAASGAAAMLPPAKPDTATGKGTGAAISQPEEAPATTTAAAQALLETQAQNEFSILEKRVTAAKPEEEAEIDKALQSFIEKYAETIVASRARVLQEHLKSPSHKPAPTAAIAVSAPSSAPAAAGANSTGPLPPVLDSNMSAADAELVTRVNDKLRELNPEYRGDGSYHCMTIGGAPHVRQVKIKANLVNLEPLTEFGSLHELSIEGVGSGTLTDLTPLKKLKLKALAISYSKVTDLSPLRGNSVGILTVSNCPLEDLRPLAGNKLYAININDTNVADLSPLKGMPVQRVYFTHTQVSDLTPVADCPLVALIFDHTPVKDITPIAACQLQSIALDVKDENALKILRNMKTLKRINNVTPTHYFDEIAKAHP